MSNTTQQIIDRIQARLDKANDRLTAAMLAGDKPNIRVAIEWMYLYHKALVSLNPNRDPQR